MPKEKVEVVAYSGYRGEEIPSVFEWRGTRVEVAEIRSRWIEEGVGDRDTMRGFRVMGKNRLADTDRKETGFCPECKKRYDAFQRPR